LYLLNHNTYFPTKHYISLYQFVEPTSRFLRSLAQGLLYHKLAQGLFYFITGTELALPYRFNS
jgi:hypothetical protein